MKNFFNSLLGVSLVFTVLFMVPVFIAWYIGFEINFIANFFEIGKDFANDISK